MSFLVRKINKAKWSVSELVEGGSASADAITNCLKTHKNTLSFWTVDSVEAIEQAVLAIAASNQNLDTFDVVVIPQSYFEKYEFVINETPGDTKCLDLVSTHRDLAGLNVQHLVLLSEVIMGDLRESKVKRYTYSQLKSLLENAVKVGRIQLDDLHENVKNKLVVKIS